MTPTEIEKINREFATEVMRWTNLGGRAKCWMEKSVNFPSESLYTGYSDKADAADYFDPYHRWDHAAMGLEKFAKDNPEYYMTLKWPSPTERDFRFRIEKYSVGCNYYIQKGADTAPAAITLACLEAKKEE